LRGLKTIIYNNTTIVSDTRDKEYASDAHQGYPNKKDLTIH